MTIFRLALTLASLTIFSGCTDIPLPDPLTEQYTDQSTKAERLKEISQRMRWMAPEKTWHYNCLFLKPIAQLNEDEQRLALVNSKIISIAYFEEKRLAYRSAGSLYRRAADQGVAYANAKLGNILIAGQGVASNPIGGTKLVQQSAQLDCAFGQYRYGELLSKGIGVKADFIDAWAWLELARRQGYEDDQKLQDKVEGFLGPVQLELANQKADTLRHQLDIFNKGPQSQQLIQCITPRNKEPFITRMRACHAMSGTHVGNLIDYRQNK